MSVFQDPLAVPRGNILQIAAKQHVISTHTRDQVTHIHEVCAKAVPHSRGALLKWNENPSTSVWTNPKVVFSPGVIKRLSCGGSFRQILAQAKAGSDSMKDLAPRIVLACILILMPTVAAFGQQIAEGFNAERE